MIIKAYESENQDESSELWISVFGDWLVINNKNMSIVEYNFDHAQNPMNVWYKYTNWLLRKINIKCKSKFGNTPWTWYKQKKFWKKITKSSLLRFYTQWIPKDFDENRIVWQVTNNSNSEQKRWEIWNSNNLWYDKNLWWFAIWEEARYSWQHWVRCYIINENKEIVAMSDKFMVNIQ
jgi:hypothetical protein